MGIKKAYNNFTGGEISPTLSGRYDLSRFSHCARRMENFLPGLHGDVKRRPGTRYVGTLDGFSVLIPFRFSVEPEQNFVLIFSSGKMRVASESAMQSAEVATPYAAEDLYSLSYAQVGDVVYLAHPKYALHKVERRGSPGAYTWELKKVALNPSLPAPGKPTVKFKVVESTANDYPLRYKVVAVDAKGKQSLPSEAGEDAAGKFPTDWVVGESCSITWNAVDGAVEYNIYREAAGYYGFIGVTKTTSFTDQNYEADTSDTPREDWNPFKNGNNPVTVAFHQQRMVLGGTKTEPQALYMSRVGDFENFRKSRPLQEDDPVEYVLASGSIDAIAWTASFGDLLIGTAGAEYKATGESGVVTAKSVKITSQSYWGSSSLAPIIVGNSILHVQRHGAKVRDLFYSLEKDGYAGNDLSIMAPHLFEGHTLKQWAYQQTPSSVIWVVRDDGLLLALTYLKEHDIWGWSRHPIDGEVVSVATLSGEKSDVLMLVTRRAGKYYLERMADEWADTEGIEDAYFVDCGLTMESETPKTEWDGLDHLEGRKVSILAGGSPVEDLTVAGGKVKVPYPVKKISVGIPYVSVIEPMPVEADTEKGTTLGKLRGYAVCSLRLHRSVGGQYGSDDSLLYDLPFVPAVWGEPCEPFSGDLTCNPNTPQRSETSLCVVQRRALPMHIVAMVLDIDFGEA